MSTDPAKGTIVVVDDEEDLVAVLKDALDLALPDYRTVTATSADAAAAAVAQLPPGSLALLCVDHRLGRASGLDLLTQLRTRFPAVPAMLFTGQATPEIAERAQRVGARVVWKPLRLGQWLGEVRSLLGVAP